MPVLDAEDALREVTRLAYGSGTLKPDAAKAVLASWQTAAGVPSARARKATPADLAEFGIAQTKG